MLGVAQVSVQAEEISGKTQNDFLHFVARVPLDSSGEFFNGSKRHLLRWTLFDVSSHLLQLILGNQRPPKLLKMQRRAILGSNRANFVAGQHMKEHFVLFEAVEKTR